MQLQLTDELVERVAKAMLSFNITIGAHVHAHVQSDETWDQHVERRWKRMTRRRRESYLRGAQEILEVTDRELSRSGHHHPGLHSRVT